MRHFHAELEILKRKLLKMSFAVEGALRKAIEALLQRDAALAEKVFEDEKLINQFEIEIDDMGHGLMALDQPMAADLRLITAILKINTDLERMGDHAINIAERVPLVIGEPPLEKIVDLPEMAALVQKMLRDALDSFVQGNPVLAEEVLTRDDRVDAYNDSLYAQLQKLMEKDPSAIKVGMIIVRVGHDLERVADLANNIAEGVIYLKQGKEVRHHIRDHS